MYLENEKEIKAKKDKEDQEKALNIQEENEKTEKLRNVTSEVQNLKTQLKKATENLNVQASVSDKLLNDAHERLKTALKKGDLCEAKVAQSLIEAFMRSKEELKEKENEVNSLHTKIGKRQSSVITNFF